jgi:hypothetical protein
MLVVRENGFQHPRSSNKVKVLDILTALIAIKRGCQLMPKRGIDKHANNAMRTVIQFICGKMIIKITSRKRKL